MVSGVLAGVVPTTAVSVEKTAVVEVSAETDGPVVTCSERDAALLVCPARFEFLEFLWNVRAMPLRVNGSSELGPLERDEWAGSFDGRSVAKVVSAVFWGRAILEGVVGGSAWAWGPRGRYRLKWLYGDA